MKSRIPVLVVEGFKYRTSIPTKFIMRPKSTNSKFYSVL